MLDIVIATAGSQMKSEYAVSLFDTANLLQDKRLNARFINAQSSIVASARQMLFDAAKELNAQRLVFIDSDMSWSTDSFERLIESDQDIVSGLYLDELGQAVAFTSNQQRISQKELTTNVRYKPLHHVGFGFISLSQRVMHALTQPFLMDGEYGEDAAFCEHARAAQFNIYLDTRIRVTHHKTIALTP